MKSEIYKSSLLDEICGRKGFYIESTPIPRKHWYSAQEYEKDTYKPCTILGVRYIPAAGNFRERLYYFIEVDGIQKEVHQSSVIVSSPITNEESK